MTLWPAVGDPLFVDWLHSDLQLETLYSLIGYTLTCSWRPFIRWLATLWPAVGDPLFVDWLHSDLQLETLYSLIGYTLTCSWRPFIRWLATLWPAVGDPLFVDWLCSCHVACMHARFVITGIFCVPVSKTRVAGLRSTWLLAMATLTSSSGWPLQGGMTLTWRPPLATLPLTWLLWMDTSTLSLWVSVLLLKMWKTSLFYPYVSAIAHLVDHSTENLGTMLMQVWVPGAARVFFSRSQLPVQTLSYCTHTPLCAVAKYASILCQHLCTHFLPVQE